MLKEKIHSKLVVSIIHWSIASTTRLEVSWSGIAEQSYIAIASVLPLFKGVLLVVNKSTFESTISAFNFYHWSYHVGVQLKWIQSRYIYLYRTMSVFKVSMKFRWRVETQTIWSFGATIFNGTKQRALITCSFAISETNIDIDYVKWHLRFQPSRADKSMNCF